MVNKLKYYLYDLPTISSLSTVLLTNTLVSSQGQRRLMAWEKLQIYVTVL